MIRFPQGNDPIISGRAKYQSSPWRRVPAALGELAYRIVRRLTRIEIGQVLSLDLASIQPLRAACSDLEYRFLSVSEVRAAAMNPAHDLDSSMSERWRTGRDLCFAAFHGDRLVNYSWYALDTVEQEHSFGAGVELARDAVYMYKAFTLPEYRGQRIHGAALSRAAAFFRECGVRQMIAIVDLANRSSLRSHAKLGFRPAGRVIGLGQRSIEWGCGTLIRAVAGR